MGLAGPKNRTKIGHDPNNTQWTRDTSRFGHKILTAQGWTPGEHLGAKNAAHSEHYTAANLSHIRVSLKDDTLGLGAPKPRERAENFGLGIFGDVLSRLNGKSEEKIEEEVQQRRDKALKLYHTERFGSMVFVSAGFLVGDEVVKRDSDKAKEVLGGKKDASVSEDAAEKTKKRKRSEDAEEEKSSKKEKKDKKKKSDKKVPEDSSASSDESSNEKEKSKKRKEKASKEADSGASETESKEERRRRKEEKRKRKEEKKKAKEEKRAKKAAKKLLESSASTDGSPEPTSGSATPSAPTNSAPSSAPASGASTPRAGLTFTGGRNMARRRYIEAKKRASQDPKALREILMIKSQA